LGNTFAKPIQLNPLSRPAELTSGQRSIQVKAAVIQSEDNLSIEVRSDLGQPTG
jgi:hypothetical protein